MNGICSVDDCGREGKIILGMCTMHYQRLLRPERTTQCSVEGCDVVGQTRRGMCETHYDRMRRRGTTDPYVPTPVSERLAAGLVRMPNGCLEWTKATMPYGYGVIGVGIGLEGHMMRTHRLAWELAHGPVPDGLCVLHHCDNPPCCDVEHLFLGTKADNTADMVAKGRQNFWGNWS